MCRSHDDQLHCDVLAGRLESDIRGRSAKGDRGLARFAPDDVGGQQQAPHFLIHQFDLLAAQGERVLLHRAFDVPESQFDLPTLLVQGGNGVGWIAICWQAGQYLFDLSIALAADLAALPMRGQRRVLFTRLRRNTHLQQAIVLAVAGNLFGNDPLACRSQPVPLLAVAGKTGKEICPQNPLSNKVTE